MKLILSFLLLTTACFTYGKSYKMPRNLKWETNNSDAIFASPNAVKGGTLRSALTSYPMTLRFIGPDANSGVRDVIAGNLWALTDIHPNTGKIIPQLATHWAYSKDKKSVYYKLDKDVRWSDGKKVTADDYIFTLKFFRSKHIVDPWSNEMYTKFFERVEKYDDYTIGIIGKIPLSPERLQHYLAIIPLPKHFYKLDKKFVRNYNWKLGPNTGPYRISKIKKGKSITVSRVKNWWGENKRYNKGRYNVDKITYKVIRDHKISYEHFKKAKLDATSLTIPDWWRKRSEGDVFKNGYAHRAWVYNDRPRSENAIYFNLDNPILADKNVRIAISHSINVGKVLKTVLRGDYERLENPSTGYGDYTNKKVKARKFNLKKADAYFKKAGWTKRGPDGIRVKNGQRMSLSIVYSAKHHQDRIVILKEEAKKAGVELSLKLMDGGSAFKTILEKQHQLAYMGWGTDRDPQYWEHIHSDNAHKAQTNNITNVDMPKFDKLADAYRNELNEKKRAKVARDIQQAIYDEALLVPLWLTPYFRVGYWGWWKFPTPTATRRSQTLFDPYSTKDGGGTFWIDKKEKERILEAKDDDKKLKPVLVKDETFRTK